MKNLKVFIFGLLLSQGYTLFSSARPLMPTFSDEELKHISDEDLGDIHCRTHYPTTQDATKALAMAANGLNYLHN